MEGRSLVESLLAAGGIWLMARELPDYATFAILALAGGLPVSGAGPGAFLTPTLHFFLSVAAGLLLIMLRRPIAAWVHPADSGGTVAGDGLLAAGLGVLSIYFIGTGAIALGRLIGPSDMGMDMGYQVWSGVVSIVVGAILFAGTRWIAGKPVTGS
jgi:hypothetical protein